MTQDHGTVKKLPYLEGDWVAVPLRGEAGGGVGRISRMAPRGRALVGYFFGDRFPTLPTLRQVSHLKPDQAVLIRRFGDLGLIRGEWKVIGGASDFDRSVWPMPKF